MRSKKKEFHCSCRFRSCQMNKFCVYTNILHSYQGLKPSHAFSINMHLHKPKHSWWHHEIIDWNVLKRPIEESFLLSSSLNYGLLQKQGYITPRRGTPTSVYMRRCSNYRFIASTANSFHLRLHATEIMDHHYHPFETQTVPVYTNTNHINNICSCELA